MQPLADELVQISTLSDEQTFIPSVNLVLAQRQQADDIIAVAQADELILIKLSATELSIAD